MEPDLRDTDLYREVDRFFVEVFEPGSGQVIDAVDVAASPDGSRVALTGKHFEDLEGPPTSRVYVADLSTGEMTRVTRGPNDDRFPTWSPDGSVLAFSSDRAEKGTFQLYLLDADRPRRARAAGPVNGTVEYHSWSPEGGRILVGVAGLGADLAGAEGGTKIAAARPHVPDWVPSVERGDAEDLWRRAWLYDVGADQAEVVSRQGLNIWESVWCGPDSICAVVSDSHSEAAWYTARLVLIDLESSEEQVLYEPSDQIGWPVASPSGERLAVVEAVCSDRWIVAGDVLLFDVETGEHERLDSDAVDVTWLEWRDEGHLMYAGHRAFETVIGEFDLKDRRPIELWADTGRTFGEWYPAVSPLPDGGAVAVGEAYAVPPELAVIDRDGYRAVASFATETAAELGFAAGRMVQVTWKGPDGLLIHGWMARPRGPGPYPLVMNLHGGPIYLHRNRWMGRLRATELLVRHGYAVFLPNPRGSAARGQDFARMVIGDMGGADSDDCLAGIDALVQRGVADPGRLGITGISYGGFMAAWLITQDQRFAAAVPISPVTDWYSQHRTSQIPFFDELFLEASSAEPGGKFFARSPVFGADRVTCPTLVMAGALDKNTPPSQAVEFYRSLLEHGVETELALYPKAGHGMRQFPEVVDATTRVLAWFLEHMPPARGRIDEAGAQ